MKIALCIIATGKYSQFVEQLLTSARQFFLPGHTTNFFVFSDKPGLPAADVQYWHTAHEAWPGPTLHRYRTLLQARTALAAYDYVFYVDADSTFVGTVSADILGDLVAVLHSGYLDTPAHRLPYERRPSSNAYIPRGGGARYYAGGFQGGNAARFLAAISAMAQAIDIDERRNVVAAWHDESHWNRYLLDNPPTLVLDYGYHWPEGARELPDQKIRLLAKNHAVMRAPDIYDTAPYTYLKDWPLGQERLREEVIQDYHCGKNIRPTSLTGVQAVVTHLAEAGLCNRLRALVGAAVLAEAHDLPHYITWEPSLACPAAFADILTYNGFFIPRDVMTLLKPRDNLVVTADGSDRNNPRHYPGGAPVALYYEQLRDMMPAQTFLDKVTAKMREITPAPAIAERIAVYKQTWPEKVIGIHARRTDQISNVARCYSQKLNDDTMIAAVRRELVIDPTAHFFLATDNATTAAQFRELFGDAILPSPVSYKKPQAGGPARHTTVADAVFDLYCLASTQKLLGTWMSTFSHYAVDMGGIPNEQFH